ncbi:MAG: amidase [Alphaproteobacteria bacterium]
MPISDYSDYDALGLAGLVKRGEVSAAELAEEAIARIEKHNGALNAVIFTAFDEARERAGKVPDGAFKGVPFLLKDILGDMAGWPTTQGSAFMRDYRAPVNSELTNRFLAAGLNPLGKTNVPEIGTMPVCEPHFYGPARNPWNTDHTPGGSSGGSAACVAAGIVPVAHANDGGGSIRIPASSCGLVGLKPTRMRNPCGPVLGDVMSGLVEEHIVSRTVRDTAAMLDATAGPDAGAPYFAPPPPASFLEESGQDPARLRIALSTKNMRNGEPYHPECMAALQAAAKLCEELGHEVSEAAPPVDSAMFAEAFTGMWVAHAAGALDGFAIMAGKTLNSEEFEPFTWALHEAGKRIAAPQYIMARTFVQMAGREMGRFFQEYDVHLAPTLGEPPARIGRFDTSTDDPETVFGALADYVVDTPVYNATGQPSISLPLHWSADGLPVGVMFSGRLGAEATLLRLAGQIERAAPWHGRRPPLFG